VTGILVRMRERGRIDFGPYLARRRGASCRAPSPCCWPVWSACSPSCRSPTGVRTAGEIFASAVDLENWALIAAHLLATPRPDVATPVQHYWTLAVEAQFYILWALMLMPDCSAGVPPVALSPRSPPCQARSDRPPSWPASLATSIVWCAVDPSSGYLSTATRMWELAAGGVLTMLGAPHPPLRIGAPLAAVGWLLIAASFLFLNPRHGVARHTWRSCRWPGPCW